MLGSIIKILVFTAIIAAAAFYFLFVPIHATRISYKG